MKIKTYRSPSIPRAVDLIKQELGPGAVILNTKRIKKRRFLGLIPSLAFEITAASEPQPEQVSKRPNRARRTKKGSGKRIQPAPLGFFELRPPDPKPVVHGYRSRG